MATRLFNIVRFTAVPVAAQATLPHFINLDDRAVVPDEILRSNGDFSIVSVTATDVTVQNDGAAPANVDVLCQRWDPFMRAFGVADQPSLTPQPFVAAAGVGGNFASVADVESELWFPPAAPNVENDEFNTTPLTGWTRTYTPSVSAIDPVAGFAGGDPREDLNGFRRSWFRVQPPGDAVTYTIHKQFAGGGALPDGLYLCRLGWEYRFGSVQQCEQIGIRLAATAAGLPDLDNGVLLVVAETDLNVISPQTVVRNNAVSSGVVQMPDQENTGDHFQYGAIIRNGDTFSVFVGTGQGSWTWLADQAYVGTGGGSPAIDRVAFEFINSTTGAPGNQIYKVDFFRYFPQLDLP
jgi:hypothetical protein